MQCSSVVSTISVNFSPLMFSGFLLYPCPQPDVSNKHLFNFAKILDLKKLEMIDLVKNWVLLKGDKMLCKMPLH